MKHSLNGVLSETSAAQAIQAKQLVRCLDFVVAIRGLVQDIMKRVKGLEHETFWALKDAANHVCDEDLKYELKSAEMIVEDESDEIRTAADRLLKLVERLGKRSEAAVARAELFNRCRKYKNEERDREIARLRDEQHKSFGSIALDMKMEPGTVRRAYKRYKTRHVEVSAENRK
jgi:hypothetical protein